MKPAAFDYLAPSNAEEAIGLLAEYGSDGRFLAGGQSLIALMNFRLARPAALIDLGRCPELDYIEREGDWIAIGPMTRQGALEHSEVVRDFCPLLLRVVPFLGNPVIRNRGTIGGTIAHADRVAELPGVAMALDAIMIAQGPKGTREIEAAEFFVDDLTTSLVEGEMLREIRFPTVPPNTRTAFVEANNRHHDLAIVAIAVQLENVSEGRCETARISAIGMGPTPVRFKKAEAVLTSQELGKAAFSEAAAVCLDGIEAEDDVHAGEGYRAAVTPGLLVQALRIALPEYEKAGSA